MKEIETILCATNFTEQAAHAARFAASISKRTGARIVIIHAVDEISDSLMPKNQVLRFAKHWLAKARADLEQAGASVRDSLLEEGRPNHVILDAVEEIDANLVVLSTRSAAEPDPQGLGHVAERVLRRSPAPVLLVPPDASVDLKKILCAFDRSEAAAHALKSAAALAQTFGATLDVLHVIREPDVEEILGYHPGQEFLDKVKVPSGRELESKIRKEKDFLEARIAELGLEGLQATTEVRVGKPSREITRQAKSGRYDLLVIGAVGRRDNPRVYLGRTAKKVAEHLHCATLFLRDADMWHSQIEEDIEEIARNYRKARELIKERKFKMAIRKLRRCLSKAPYFAPALEQLSKAYQQTGYKAEADALSKKAKLIREKLKR